MLFWTEFIQEKTHRKWNKIGRFVKGTPSVYPIQVHDHIPYFYSFYNSTIKP